MSRMEPNNYNQFEDRPDLYDLWLVITKHKRFIWIFTITITVIVFILTLLMTNYYKSKTVILPVAQHSNIGSLSNLSGLAAVAGIYLPQGNSENEIIALIRSNILKEEVIKNYNLLPILFYSKWDAKRHQWKKAHSYLKVFIYNLKWKLLSLFRSIQYKPPLRSYPIVNDGVRRLSKLMNVSQDHKLNTITISVDYPNPYVAKKIVQDILITLKQHLCNEAIRLAEKNKKLLEKELIKTSDPIIQQKIYALIAKQIETIITAKINENFAFKVIDPPSISTKIDKPRRVLIVTVTFVACIFFSIVLVFFIEYISIIKNNTFNRVKENEKDEHNHETNEDKN